MEAYQNAAPRARISALNLQSIANNLDISYISKKLRQVCLSISHQRVYKTEYHFGLLEELLEYIEQQDLLRYPAISIYYYSYHALSNPKEGAHFQRFKNSVLEHADLFPEEETRDLYLLAINYCVKKYNEGEPDYLEDQFELYQVGLEKKHLLTNGVISRFTYRNAVTMGLILKQYDWVEAFIYQHRITLEKDYN